MAWYDSLLSAIKNIGTNGFQASVAPTEPNMSTNNGPAVGYIKPATPAPNMSTNNGPAVGYIRPSNQPSATSMFGGPMQSVYAPTLPAQPTIRPISTGVSTKPTQFVAAPAREIPIQPVKTIYNTNPTNAPTLGLSGTAGATSTNSLSQSTATSYGGAGGGTFQGSVGMSGITSPNGTTGRSSAGTAGYNASNSVDIYGTQDEERKKQTENTLKTLIANLENQVQSQTGFSPSLLSNLEQFNPSATPNVNRLKAAETSAASLVSQLSNPAVKLTPEQANAQFQQLYTQSYQKFQQTNPIPEKPVVPTPEQLAAEQQNPTLKEIMDQTRVQLGLPDLEKARLDTIAQLNAANDSYNTLIKSIKDNPEIPLSLQQRRIEEFTKANDVAIKSLMGKLDYTNQQITDANEKLNREYQIAVQNKSDAERKLDNNRSLLGTLISSGTIANFTPDQIQQWATLSGIDSKSLTQLSAAVKAKVEATYAKDEAAAKTADLRQQQIISAINKSNAQTIIVNANAQNATQSSAGQVVNASTGNPAKLTNEQSTFLSQGQTLSQTANEIKSLLTQVPTSAIKGWVTEKGYLVPVIQDTFANNPAALNLMQKMFTLNNLFVYFSSGKQINESEFERLGKQLPNFRATPEYNNSAINNFVQNVNSRMDNFLKVNGWTIKGGGQTSTGTTGGSTYTSSSGKTYTLPN